MLHVEYLVVGSGATAMAFVDTLLSSDADVTVAMVDRRHVPGGHWNDAYPYVRLHQPSQYYGVASRELGRGRKDTDGLNQGLYELASGVEVTAYFHDVMEDVFLPSGRVTHLPSSEYDHASGTVTSLLSGEHTEVTHRTLVDAGFLTTSIPLTHDRPFEVAVGVDCQPPNHLARLAAGRAHIVIIGGGKTGIDSITWLLGHGFPAENITWVVPRDSWLVNRLTVQPGAESFHNTIGALATQTEICAAAGSIEELCLQQEEAGIWLRADPDVWPTMFHAATISTNELDEMRKVGNVVRGRHVSGIEPGRLLLADGETVACHPEALYVDCTASAAATNVGVREPIFADGRINLQMVRPFQPCFSAALIGRIEATVDSDRRNQLTRPTPMTDVVADWLRITADGLLNAGAWSQEPALDGWLASCRLNAIASLMAGVDPEAEAEMAVLGRLLTAVPPAVENLFRLADEEASRSAS